MPLFPPQDYRKTLFTHRRGTRAAQPAATDVLPGTLYFVTDEGIIERSNGTIWELYSGSSGLTNINISAGTTSNNLSNLVFSNSNGVTFGLNGSTITASIGAGGAPGSISAGTTSMALGQAVFSNSNGVSFGLNVSTVTASIATSLTNINLSAGTTSNNLSAFVFSNSNNISFGLDGSTITATATVGSTQGSIRISAGTTSILSSAFTFSNSNNVSFGIDNGTITASIPNMFRAFTASDQIFNSTVPFNTTGHIGLYGEECARIIFGNAGESNRITVQGLAPRVGFSTLGNTSGNTGLQSNLGHAVFVGGNNITLSGSTSSSTGGGFNTNRSVTITISGRDVHDLSLGGNSTSAGAGFALVSSGTLILAGGNNITLSQNGNSVTISAGAGGVPQTISQYEPYPFPMPILSTIQQLQNSLIFQPFEVYDYLSAYRMNLFAGSVELSIATSNATGSGGLTLSCALYGRDTASTERISRLWSGSVFWQFTNSSHTRMSVIHPVGILNSTAFSTSTFSSAATNVSTYRDLVRGPRVIPFPVSMILTPGHYWLAAARSLTNANGSFNLSLSMMGNTLAQLVGMLPLAGIAFTGSSSVTRANPYQGAGPYSITSNNFPASITLSQIHHSQVMPFLHFNFSAFTTGSSLL